MQLSFLTIGTRIGTRLGLAFGLLVLMMLGITAVGVLRLDNIEVLRACYEL
jgi:methyl-accepting chemotaxis protein